MEFVYKFKPIQSCRQSGRSKAFRVLSEALDVSWIKRSSGSYPQICSHLEIFHAEEPILWCNSFWLRPIWRVSTVTSPTCLAASCQSLSWSIPTCCLDSERSWLPIRILLACHHAQKSRRYLPNFSGLHKQGIRRIRQASDASSANSGPRVWLPFERSDPNEVLFISFYPRHVVTKCTTFPPLGLENLEIWEKYHWGTTLFQWKGQLFCLCFLYFAMIFWVTEHVL